MSRWNTYDLAGAAETYASEGYLGMHGAQWYAFHEADIDRWCDIPSLGIVLSERAAEVAASRVAWLQNPTGLVPGMSAGLAHCMKRGEMDWRRIGSAAQRDWRDWSGWRRLGSEAQSDDLAHGHAEPIDNDTLEAVLADHFSVDLDDPEICEDRDAALRALVLGYREGG